MKKQENKTKREITDLKKEEILAVIEKEGEIRKSKAKRVNHLFFKYKGWFRTRFETAPVKSPVMFFHRRTGDVEFYENVTAGLWEYKHSDGTQRFLIVNPATQEKYDFADKMFKGYFAHEDYPMTGLPDPFLTSEQINIMIEKALNDKKEWETKQVHAKTGLIKAVFWGLAILFGIFVIFKVIVPSQPEQVVQVVRDVAPAIINNGTATVLP